MSPHYSERFVKPRGTVPPPEPVEADDADPAAPPRWPAWYAFAGYFAGFLGAGLLTLPLVLVLKGAGAGEPATSVVGTIALDAVLVAIAVALAAQTSSPRPEHFGLRPTRLWPAVGWALLGFLAYLGVAFVYTQYVDVDQSTLDDLNADASALATVAVGLLLVVVAPICEEIFFRGFLFGALRSSFRLGPAAVIAGVLFGLVHLPTGPSAVPMLSVLGVALCIVYAQTRSLYPTIALHALNNTAGGADQIDRWGIILSLGVLVVGACILVPRVFQAPDLAPARQRA